MTFTREGLLTALLVIAALFFGSYITTLIPTPDQVTSDQPFFHEVAVGETAQMRTGSVTVTGVETASQVELFAQIAGTSGVWLVVDVEFEPIGQSTLIAGGNAVLRAVDGRTLGGTQAVTTNCGPTPPGMMVTCQLAFELPSDALEGAHLWIPAGASVNTSDDVADVDLGIDAERAAELAATDQHLELIETTAVTK